MKSYIHIHTSCVCQLFFRFRADDAGAATAVAVGVVAALGVFAAFGVFFSDTGVVTDVVDAATVVAASVEIDASFVALVADPDVCCSVCVPFFRDTRRRLKSWTT